MIILYPNKLRIEYHTVKRVSIYPSELAFRFLKTSYIGLLFPPQASSESDRTLLYPEMSEINEYIYMDMALEKLYNFNCKYELAQAYQHDYKIYLYRIQLHLIHKGFPLLHKR